MSDSGRIDVLFEPEKHVGEWVWLWCFHRRDWQLCQVIDDSPDPAMVRAFDGGLGITGPKDFWGEVPAEELARLPCVPMLRPTAEPGSGLEIAVRLPEGCSLAIGWGEPGEDVDRCREACVGYFWPVTWDRSWWKPSGAHDDLSARRCDLLKAGALVIAEIERLDRLAEKDND